MSLAAIWALARGLASSWQYVVMGVLLVGALWYRGAYHDCKAARLAEALAAKERAEALSNELVIEQAKAMAATTEKAVSYVDRIKSVQVPRDCPADERDRITNRGVRDIIHGAPE